MEIIVNTIVKNLWSLVSDVLCHELINCVWDYPIYLLKEGSLFCFVIMRSTELRCFRSCSWCFWKSLNEKGCLGLIPWCLDLQRNFFWILNDFSLKIKLNRSWKFRKIGMCLWCCWKDLDEQDLMEFIW